MTWPQRKNNKRKLIFAAGAALGIGTAAVLLRRSQADLTGSVVLITGGSRGLGLLMAREFALQGCRIAVCARDIKELDRARQDLEAHGAEVLALSCDVTDREQVDWLIRDTLRHFGRIDILVNNAGVIQVGPIQNMTHEDFDKAMSVIFWGMLNPTLAVLPGMLERKSGRIVNITSIGGKVSVPHLLPYNCAKFASVGLSEGLRSELRGQGIRVTTVVPGLMRTGSYRNAYFKGRQAREHAWFGLGASLPVISMNAERAARQIVRATRRGEPERVLSWPANVLARFHGLFPGTTADLLGLINRLVLPSPASASTHSVRGAEVQEGTQSRLFSALTTLGRNAAEQFHQHPGPQSELVETH